MKQIALFVMVAALASCTQRESSRPDLFSAGIDTTVNPGNDFFRYAFGKWIKEHPIQAAESSVGIGLDVQNEIYSQLRGICESAALDSAAADPNTQRIGALWATGMDSLGIEGQGIRYLQPYLDKIDGIADAGQLVNVLADMQQMGIGVPFALYVGQDDKNSEKYALNFYQSGLGLPDRDYYFKDDARTRNIRERYVQHIGKMLRLMGNDSVQASAMAGSIMKFETGLANASRKLEDLRDPYLNYNKFATSAFEKKFPAIDWSRYFSQLNIKTDSLIVGQPDFMAEVNKQVKSGSLAQWKSYLKWHLVRTYSSRLSNAFVKESFSFYQQLLRGRKELRPRWKRILDAEGQFAGHILGQEYVKRYFPEQAKRRYVAMVDAIIESYGDHIMRLDWMTDSTKQLAMKKLKSIRKKVGYPDKWKDYSTLSFTRESFLSNVIAADRWDFQDNINRLGKPVDRDEWFMTPQTYNAYYSPSNNEIVLPAAIFKVPGFKDEDVDDAVAFGYVGASTIGHELTHGFDDQGSQYDAGGNLKSWWSKSDREKFEMKVNGIVRQFDGYVVLDSLHINGKATAGENIADLGGIAIAIDAFKKTEQFKKGEPLNGLSPMQRYFFGYALGWKMTVRDEQLAMQVMTDVHSPAFLRVNGPFSNIPEFYEAFGVKPGAPMYRPDSVRVTIW